MTRESRAGTARYRPLTIGTRRIPFVARLLLSYRPTGRGAAVLAPTFARGPRLHRTGAADPSWPGRRVSGGPALFLCRQSRRARQAIRRHVPARSRRRRRPADPRPARGAQRHSRRPAGPSWPSGSARSAARTPAADRRRRRRRLLRRRRPRRFPGDARRRGGLRAASARTMRAALDASRELAIPTIADDRRRLLRRRRRARHGLRPARRRPRRRASRSRPAKIGISYPQEDVHRLVELVGPGQAARLLFTAAERRRRRGGARSASSNARCPRAASSADRGDPRQCRATASPRSSAPSALAAEGVPQRCRAGPPLRRADRRRGAGAPARSAAAEMIGARPCGTPFLLVALLLAACGQRRRPRRRNGAAAPTPATDNRIECRIGDAAAVRALLHDRAAPTAPAGRTLTVRKPDGGFRRLLRRPRRPRRRRRRRRRARPR